MQKNMRALDARAHVCSLCAQLIRNEKFKTSNENCEFIVNNRNCIVMMFCFAFLNRGGFSRIFKKDTLIGLTFEARSLLKLV